MGLRKKQSNCPRLPWELQARIDLERSSLDFLFLLPLSLNGPFSGSAFSRLSIITTLFLLGQNKSLAPNDTGSKQQKREWGRAGTLVSSVRSLCRTCMYWLAATFPLCFLFFLWYLTDTWNSSDQIMGLYCSQQSSLLVQLLLKGWMWLSLEGAHRCTFAGLEKQRFMARLFLCASKAVWGLGPTQAPNFCLCEGRCTCCCSFLTIDERFHPQILLWVLLKCVPHGYHSYLVLNFLCEQRTECSLLRQQHFPIYTQGKRLPLSTGLNGLDWSASEIGLVCTFIQTSSLGISRLG